MSMTFSRVAALLLLLLLAVWMPTLAVQTTGEFKEKLRFTDKTETKKINLTIPASARLVSISVKSALQSGAINWTLRDASGKVRLSGEGRGKGKYIGSTGDIDAIPGDWTLEVGFEDATGSYDIACLTG